MSSSNNRFGRRTDRQNDEPRFEPVLSFNPKRPGTRAAQGEAAPTGNRKPQAGPRVEREDAEEFGISFGDEQRIERDDDFDPRTRREKALEQRDTDSEQMLYHHLFDEQENRRRGFGWMAALGSVAVVAIGAAFAWNNFMSRPAPGNLLQPPGFASRGNNTGYITPQQPTTADTGSNIGSTPSPLAATPPAVTPPAPTDQQPAKDIAAAPQPKSVPAEAPPPPKKTISEVAANPGNLGPATNPEPASNTAPPAPPAAKQPAVAPAQVMTPPPKREAAKTDTAKTDTAKTDTPKPEAPRKEASLTPPRPAPAPAPAPQNTAPRDTAPPAVTQPAAAPAVTAPPRPHRRQATAQPQPLTRDAPAAYAQSPQQQPPLQRQQPDNLGPPPGTPDTVTVDGVTYVSGQEPHSLGTLGGPPQAGSNDAAMTPSLPAMPPPATPPAYTARPYTPSDHAGGAPLPNDVIILPSGQMAIPNRP